MPLVGALIGAAVFYFSSDIRVYFGAKAFAESKLELEDKKKQKHANRESIEKEIKDILEYNTTSADRKFAVVSGRREVGKSEALYSMFSKTPGVVLVQLTTNNDTGDAIMQHICKQFSLGNSSEHFEALMKEVNKRIRPIIIIEIDNKVTEPLVITGAETFARHNCVADYKSMVFIVPSDNASTDNLITGNGNRRQLIWVGPMTVKMRLWSCWRSILVSRWAILGLRMLTRLLRLVARREVMKSYSNKLACILVI